MRRILNQTANAAARTKGSIFEIVYRRQVQRMGPNQAIGVIAHRLCQLIWILLHRKVRYEERGPAVTETSKRKRLGEDGPRTALTRLSCRATNPPTGQLSLRRWIFESVS